MPRSSSALAARVDTPPPAQLDRSRYAAPQVLDHPRDCGNAEDATARMRAHLCGTLTWVDAMRARFPDYVVN